MSYYTVAIDRDPLDEVVDKVVGFFENTYESMKDYLKTEGFTALESGYLPNISYMGHGSGCGKKDKSRNSKDWVDRNPKHNKPGQKSTKAYKKGKQKGKKK